MSIGLGLGLQIGRTGGAAAASPTAAAPLFRAVATATGNVGTGGTLVVNKPTGTVDDDLMLLCASTTSTVAFTPPANWTLVATVDLSGTEGGSGNKIAVYRKVASSEGANYTFTAGAFSNLFLGIITWYSDTAQPLVVNVSATSLNTPATTSHVAPTVTTTIENAALNCFYTLSGSFTGTPHSGMTERWDTSNGGTGYLMTAIVEATGATGTRTMTSTGSVTGAAITVAVAEDVS